MISLILETLFDMKELVLPKETNTLFDIGVAVAVVDIERLDGKDISYCQVWQYTLCSICCHFLLY